MFDQTDPGNFIKHNGEYTIDDKRFFMKDFLLTQSQTPASYIKENYEFIQTELMQSCTDLGFEFREDMDEIKAMLFTRMPQKYNTQNREIPIDLTAIFVRRRDEIANENKAFLLVEHGAQKYYIESDLFNAEIVMEKGENIPFVSDYNPFAQLSKGEIGVESLSDKMKEVVNMSIDVIAQSQINN
jgi:hypothetical protein